MRREGRVIWGILLSTLLLYTSASAQTVRTPDTPVELEHTFWALSVQDAATGAQLVDVRAHHLLTPASTMKLVSTATALSVKGKDYRYSTTVATDGLVVDSTLRGNLYILGSGDPSIGSRLFFDDAPDYFFTRIATVLKDKGITNITGAVIGRAPAEDFQANNPHWVAYDMGNHYAVGAYELNAYDNSYTLRITGNGKVLTVEPRVPGLRLTPMYGLDPSRSSDSLYISPFPLSDGSYPITGVYPARSSHRTVRGAVPSPPLYVAGLVTDMLQRRGIKVAQPPTTETTVPDELTTLYTFSSPALSEIIKLTNTYSHNLFAEGMLRLVGEGVAPLPGHNRIQTSIKELYSYWQGRGLDTRELEMLDGSGLSPENKVSPYFLTSMLGKVYRESSTQQFRYLLPRAGVDGTLVVFLKKTPLEGKAYLKSGTIRNVVCYAGYISHGGKLYTVALMVNNYYGKTSTVRRGMERVLLDTFGL